MNIKSKRNLSAAVFLLLNLTAFSFDRPIVTNIKTEFASGGKINILWTNPQNTEKPVTKYLIYRDTKPFTEFNDINNATFITQIPSSKTGYTDTVKDLSDYFYAVISFTDECCTILLPAMNATVTGVKIESRKADSFQNNKKEPENRFSDGSIRETPLPYLDLIEGMSVTENKLSDEAVKKAKGLGITSRKKTKKLEPYYFEEDMISAERGDAYYLFQTLTKYFTTCEYQDAIEGFKKLIGTNITQEVEHRTIFYLGESYYFSGDYKNAVRSFVKVQEYYPEECKRWLESSLDQLEL